MPKLPQRLVHANKKIQLAPEILVNDLERVYLGLKRWKLEVEKETDNTFNSIPNAEQNVFSASNVPPLNSEFILIGRRHLRDNNSWMHNHEKLMRGHNRCTAMINPDDAARLNISDKEIVKISSRVGTIHIPAELTNQIMQGVVSIPHGYGHHRAGTHLDVAEKYAGVSLNDLTDEKIIDTLTGNAAFNSVRVGVEKVNK